MKRLLILISSSVLIVLNLLGGVSLIITEYTELVVQTGSDTIVPWSEHNGGQFGDTYLFLAAIEVDGDTVTGATVSGPEPFGSKSMDYDAENDGGGYFFEQEFVTAQEMTAAAPAGAYTFSGSEATSGAFNQAAPRPGYAPLTQLKVTNYQSLQSFDPGQPLTIQWEAFTEGQGQVFGPNQGYDGLINVEVWYWDPSSNSNRDVWDEEEVVGDTGFGLVPTATSVTIPAGRLTGSPDGIYNVGIFFVRIDHFETTENPPDAIVAAITGYELELAIQSQSPTPTWGQFPVIQASGGNWADTGGWIGWVEVTLDPWVWRTESNEYIYVPQFSADAGTGWIYTP